MQAAVDQAVQADARLRGLYGEFPVHFRRRPQENLAGMSPFGQGARHGYLEKVSASRQRVVIVNVVLR